MIALQVIATCYCTIDDEHGEAAVSLHVKALCTSPLHPTLLCMVSANTCAVAMAVTGLQRELVTAAAAAVAFPALRAALAAAAAAAAVALELSLADWRQFRMAVDWEAASMKAVAPPA